jgi:hypothetical protein
MVDCYEALRINGVKINFKNCTLNCTLNFKKDRLNGENGIPLLIGNYLKNLQLIDIVEKNGRPLTHS